MKDYYQDPQVSKEHVCVFEGRKKQSDHRLIAYGSSHNGLTSKSTFQRLYFFNVLPLNTLTRR